MQQWADIDIFDKSLDSHAIITVSRERGTELLVHDDGKELVTKEFPNLRSKKWKRLPRDKNGAAMNCIRIRRKHGLDIARALARYGLRTMVQDMTEPDRIKFLPLDALLRESRPDLS